MKNYRAYAEEKFSFEDIQFCTINGPNGAGKSSLFMDAMIDCIYEEPREGKSTSVKVPWLRNEDKVRSGYIMFTFLIGSKTYRITRTRAKSGKGTLNLAQMAGGVWEDRSCEKFCREWVICLAGNRGLKMMTGYRRLQKSKSWYQRKNWTGWLKRR